MQTPVPPSRHCLRPAYLGGLIVSILLECHLHKQERKRAKERATERKKRRSTSALYCLVLVQVTDSSGVRSPPPFRPFSPCSTTSAVHSHDHYHSFTCTLGGDGILVRRTWLEYSLLLCTRSCFSNSAICFLYSFAKRSTSTRMRGCVR